MKKLLRKAAPLLLTLVSVAGAAVIALHLLHYYHDEPWTRDARIGADVIQVAPDVSGPVTELAVTDNQAVQREQVLFIIDRTRYVLALRQASSALMERRALLAQARREAERDHTLRDLISRELVEQGHAKLEQAQAAVDTAEAALDVAQLNLDRTVVVSPVNGFLSDRSVRVGDYVAAGRPVLSLVDGSSYHVAAYFEETKLRRVRIGQRVDLRIMGEPGTMTGHIESIAAGIEDRDRADGLHLLPNINPAFNWVRLAQRIPVRIAIDQVPKDLRLIAGR
ncbi:MAG: HlyD family secretion protein, partial [Hydrocarboniphaga sp.]|uniref:efflux RND transporter periplasmic adaptor subunit n=1 Tax=Hydrocarboniphaga sp. TaxID=2033016 RepID=UPI0026248B9C